MSIFFIPQKDGQGQKYHFLKNGISEGTDKNLAIKTTTTNSIFGKTYHASKNPPL